MILIVVRNTLDTNDVLFRGYVRGYSFKKYSCLGCHLYIHRQLPLLNHESLREFLYVYGQCG